MTTSRKMRCRLGGGDDLDEFAQKPGLCQKNEDNDKVQPQQHGEFQPVAPEDGRHIGADVRSGSLGIGLVFDLDKGQLHGFSLSWLVPASQQGAADGQHRQMPGVEQVKEILGQGRVAQGKGGSPAVVSQQQDRSGHQDAHAGKPRVQAGPAPTLPR